MATPIQDAYGSIPSEQPGPAPQSTNVVTAACAGRTKTRSPTS
jgi:hypothetical protein